MPRCPGTEHRLPGELELADQYGVSRDTIRRAIRELVSENRWLYFTGEARSSSRSPSTGRQTHGSGGRKVR